MVVSTSVSGMKGRHSASGPGPPRAPVRLVLAVLGACAVVIAGVVAGVAAAGSGGRDVAGSAAAAASSGESSGQRSQAIGATPAPSASAASAAGRAGASGSPGSRGSAASAQPTAGTTAGAADGQDPLGTTAAAYVSGRAGTVLAAVYDVGTGRTWRLGQGRPQAEASVVKLDVLETLLAERGPGLSVSDRSLTAQMIEDSDNDAATSLWYEVGGPASIRSFNTEAGLTRTAPSSCVVCPGFAWPGWGLTTTTPDDQIALLKQLVTANSLLTSTERGYALWLMENVTPTQRWGISGGVPAQATVALKNGWLPLPGTSSDWQVNSVGWVSGGGRDYLIAILTTGNPSEQYGVDTIERLAAMVWQGLR
jgi:hypothetical protein